MTNAGTLSFNGDEATYGQDPIAINSTAAANRTWTLSGAGSFSFTDVSVSYQTGAATITATSSNDSGNNVNWIFATTKVISGYLYNGIGGSLITAVKTIAVSVNGAAATTTTTDGTGFYTLTLASLPANNTVGVFVSGDAGTKASAITKTAATADIGINIDLFQNYSVLRHEDATTSLTNTDLDTADNVGDADLLESVTASVPTFTQGIYILNNKVFAPGNNVVVQGSFANYGAFTQSTYTVTFDGTGTVLGTSITSFTNVTINNTMTLTGHATNMNVSGNFLNNGTFTHNSGTITFNGAAGQTFTTGAQTYNNIVLNNTGTAGANERITVSGNLDINGNLTITDGALYLVTNNPTVNIAGNVAIASIGIVTKGSGAWTFDGTTATTYSDLAATTSDLGAVTLNKTDAGSPSVNNVLTATGNMKTDSLTIDGTAGQEDTLSIATTKTVTVTTGSTTTINSGATISGAGTLDLIDTAGANLSTTGTLSTLVRFVTATGSVVIPARTYGAAVTAYNSTSSNYTVTLGTATSQTINFNSHLTIQTASTGQLNPTAATYNPTINILGDYAGGWSSFGSKSLNMGTGTWTVGGNWNTNSAGTLTANTSTLIFNGNGKTISTNEHFYNTIIRGNVTISGIYYVDPSGGGVSPSFTIDNGYTVTVTGTLFIYNTASTLTLNGDITGSGYLKFEGLDSGKLLNGSGSISVSNINFNNGCANSTVPGRTFNGNVIVTTGNCTSSSYTAYFGKTNGDNIIINGNLTMIAPGTGTNTFDTATFSSNVFVTGNVTTTKSSTGVPTINMGTGTWTVGGNIDLAGAAVVPGASTLTMNNANGLVTQTLNSNAQSLNNLTHSGAGTLQLLTNTLTLNGTLTNSAGFFNANNLDMNIAGNLNNTAYVTNTTTNTLTFNGSASGKTINSNSAAWNNVTINHATGGWTLTDAMDINGNFTITLGTLDTGGFNMTVAGNWSNAATFNPGAGTVYFDKASSSQTLNSGGVAAGKLFNNVTHSGAGTLQLITNTINIDGNFVNSAGTFDSNSQNVTLAGNYNTTGGTVTTGSSTVTFDAAVAQSITSASQSFYNLTLNNSGSGAGDDITPADALDINGTFTITDGQLRSDTNNINTTISGNLTIGTNGTLTKGSGTTTFDGNLTASTLTDSSSAAPQNLGFITINKNNIITPAANLLTLATATKIDSLNIAASNILATAGYAIADTGDWANSGTASIGSGTVTLTGAGGSTQNISGNTTFNNLTATASSARTLRFGASSTTTVTGTWTVTGASSQLITLTSISAPTQWNINSAVSAISYADINYSNNTGPAICATFSTSTNDNNTLWGIIAGGGSCNAAPNAPTSLLQKKVTGGATLATGDWTGEDQVTFSALADDPDATDTLYLCVEKDYIETALASTNGGDLCGTGVAYTNPTPVTVSVTITGLTDTKEYHWQAQVKDAATAYSSFVTYGGNTENPPTNPAARDFGVDTTAPTGGTVNDGTGADQDWNDGLLTELSANWSFDGAVSGIAKYEFVVRRLSDSYYWNATAWQLAEPTWTDNSTTASVTVSSMNLHTGEVYYFSVRATDNAGNVSTPASSNGQGVTPSLSFALSSNSLTFTNLSGSNDYLDTKSMTTTTSTNASSGYSISAYITALLTSSGYPTKTIADFAGTWASTLTWPLGQYGFGYNSSDDLVVDVDRFSGSKFAAFSHTSPGDIIADHETPINGLTGPATDEIFTILYKVAVSNSQPATNYTTNAIYTVTANY